MSNNVKSSTRAEIIERRTYRRPLDANGTVFETAAQSWQRVIAHQRWLWERQLGRKLNASEEDELEELYWLFMDRKVTVSGRTRWLGGTEIARTREASQFNCSFAEVQTIHDVVDTIWLLLQGCGVGFSANLGVLNGFTKEIPEVEIIRSKKVIPKDEQGNPISDPSLKGKAENVETFVDGVWTIRVGDSAEAWAKFFGKLIAFKGRARKLVVSFEEIRPAGYRLSGYGWISSGDEQIAKATAGIVRVLNKSAGRLLSAMDILDIENHLGTILSSRRSAEIALYDADGPEVLDFINAKKDWYLSEETYHRAMSNNSLVFWRKPNRNELSNIFDMMIAAGGSEPAFINGVEARRRAPWFKGLNPCAEILLGDKSFCNLVETVVSRFNGDWFGLLRAHYLVARANYRQTCVNLRDGILQDTWHELNEFLRLCGVGVTGVVGWEEANDAESWKCLREWAVKGCNDMADELGTPRAKLVTTVKPSGTQTKVSGLQGDELGEGVHKPLGKYIFNNVGFSKMDPLVRILRNSGYHLFDHPTDTSSVIARLPVEYSTIPFDKVTKTINGKEVELEVNLESAVTQLERYRLLQENYVDHNCSITVSYDPSEKEEIIDWFMEHWDSYVGVSFLFRNDPTKTAEDLGYLYLPQEVVDEETFRNYEKQLIDIDWAGADSEMVIDSGEECATGACPVR